MIAAIDKIKNSIFAVFVVAPLMVESGLALILLKVLLDVFNFVLFKRFLKFIASGLILIMIIVDVCIVVSKLVCVHVGPIALYVEVPI